MECCEKLELETVIPQDYGRKGKYCNLQHKLQKFDVHHEYFLKKLCYNLQKINQGQGINTVRLREGKREREQGETEGEIEIGKEKRGIVKGKGKEE